MTRRNGCRCPKIRLRARGSSRCRVRDGVSPSSRDHDSASIAKVISAERPCSGLGMYIIRHTILEGVPGARTFGLPSCVLAVVYAWRSEGGVTSEKNHAGGASGVSSPGCSTWNRSRLQPVQVCSQVLRCSTWNTCGLISSNWIVSYSAAHLVRGCCRRVFHRVAYGSSGFIQGIVQCHSRRRQEPRSSAVVSGV